MNRVNVLAALALSLGLLGCGAPSEAEYKALLDEVYAPKMDATTEDLALPETEQKDLADLKAEREKLLAERKNLRTRYGELDKAPDPTDEMLDELEKVKARLEEITEEYEGFRAGLEDLEARQARYEKRMQMLKDQQQEKIDRYKEASSSERKRMMESLQKTKKNIASRPEEDDEDE